MKIGVYIDTNNLFQALKRTFGKQLDYTKYMNHIRDMGQVCDAIAYGAEFDSKATEFKCMLVKEGITPKYRQAVRNKRINWNTTICLDVVKKMDELDTVVISSGDGDLTPLVKFLVANDKRVIIIACGISRSLKEHATHANELFEGMLLCN